MKMHIDRVDFSSEHFDAEFDNHYSAEKPLLINNVDCFDGEKFTPEFIKQHFLDEKNRSAGWFDAALPSEDVIETPAFIQKVMARSDVSLRASPTRIFMQPKGHRTLPHYDGNSLHGLNLQIKGKKRWVITSPHTPLPTMPFLFVGMVPTDFKMDESRFDFYEFETHPGDLLLLPRYWFHEVYSLDDINLNMNWVLTPTMPNVSSKLGRREVEIVKLRDSIGLVNKIYPDDFTQYGGSGRPVIENYIQNVGLGRMLLRLLKEIASIPRFLILAGQIKSSADEFSKNNFNV